jgi:hypothetical protein
MPKRQKVYAYLWLLFILGLLGVAHFLFFRFGFHEMNPFPITRGLAFASTLWSTALLVAMALRYGWARYVLIAWLAVAMAGFAMAVLMMNSRSVKPLPEPTNMVIAGLILYALALIPLGVARSLRRFLAPRTAGGH